MTLLAQTKTLENGGELTEIFPDSQIIEAECTVHSGKQPRPIHICVRVRKNPRSSKDRVGHDGPSPSLAVPFLSHYAAVCRAETGGPA
jgi:hypothetical protein